VDAEVAAKLADLRDVKERLGCARDFIAYLDGQWSMVIGVDHPFSWLAEMRVAASRASSPNAGP
jgi:hypothetical protein